jgi:hypothetical protein
MADYVSPFVHALGLSVCFSFCPKVIALGRFEVSLSLSKTVFFFSVFVVSFLCLENCSYSLSSVRLFSSFFVFKNGSILGTYIFLSLRT